MFLTLSLPSSLKSIKYILKKKKEIGLPATTIVTRGSVLVMYVCGAMSGLGQLQSLVAVPGGLGAPNWIQRVALLDWLRSDLEWPDYSVISSGLPFRTVCRAQEGVSGLGRTWSSVLPHCI
uniref:Uncharacterized protein n=1 Tax=Myotis myotis TaxID=51298 RepID=A0A7J7ZY00_MYOMY|nr:hypothetical protein mMyoMyo1_009802 [Myotis myotis]